MITDYDHWIYFNIKFAKKYSYWKILANNGETRTTQYYSSIVLNNRPTFAGMEMLNNSRLFVASDDENFQFSSVNKEYI